MGSETHKSTFFSGAQRIPPDRIFELTAEYLKDDSPVKANLGQGAYRDGDGNPWILPSVRESRRLLQEQGLIHEYLPILGHAGFREAVARTVLGEELFSTKGSHVATCQSLSGTGALHLAGKLIARTNSPKPKVIITDPPYGNHFQVIKDVGLEYETFKYYDAATKSVDMTSYRNMLQTVPPGSVILLHACAHNPTGCDPSKDEWREIGQIMKRRKLFPIFDAAYLGFNSGSVDEDAFSIRHFIGELNLEAAICVSYAKSMGLYGERVGAVLVHAASKDLALDCQSMLEQIQRSQVSNPPAFGAKTAHLILTDEKLKKQWSEDLLTMSGRIRTMRQKLYDALHEEGAPGTWEHLINQTGMFGFLGLSSQVVVELREKYHIYMADNSRISVAGLNESNVKYVAASIAASVREEQGKK
ncbi:unnamed protein product [Clonostachys byssicola]|uniref:Aspartate aminotransferase n=1 Tax=Clonostachys byssicola TaxID=160290 RepID=A0A9N9U665_9HYPO|nr:unnamed protein product [Clonostachys byssicola]